MANSIRSKARMGLAIALLAAIAVRFIDGDLIYAGATPQPEASTAHVIPLPMHGRTIYITPAESERLGAFHWSSLLIYGLLVTLVLQSVIGSAKQKRNSQ